MFGEDAGLAHQIVIGLLAAAQAPATAAPPAPVASPAEAPPPVAPPAATVEGPRTYTAADFARFAPRTAFDMLRNVPGFVIQESDDARRGLGQATANVILNGQRFSGKTNDIQTELRRISAASVVRIEIVDGATLDIPGLSGQVANVVTVASSAVAGTFAWRPEIRTRRLPALLTRGEVAINGKVGGTDFTLSLANDSRHNGNAGPEVVYEPTGRILDRRQEVLTIFTEQPRLSGNLHRANPGGSSWNLSGSAQYIRSNLAERSLRSGPGQVDRTRRLKERQRQPNYEIGGDYELPALDGRLKLIALRRGAHTKFTQLLTVDFADGSPSTGDRYEQDAREAETILRGEYRRKAGGADWQLSVEGALNSLDVANAFFARDPAGTFQPVPFPNAVAKVEERRAEAILSYGRPLSPKLTLQASAGAEYSELAQSGPAGLTRRFVRPKGQLSLAWKPSPRTDLSLKLERQVGQLNFFDFVASGNISAGTTNAGNANLVPPQSWNIDVQGTRNLGAWGTTTARAYVRFISDIVDIIPIGATGQAPGNLDSAIRYGLQYTSTINFDPLGWKGAKLDVDLLLQRSRLTDPLTGQRREINESTRTNLNATLRWDIPRTDWAVGAGVDGFTQAYGFRLDQRFQFHNSPVGLQLFVENKDVFGLTVRGSLYGLTHVNEAFDREFYDFRRTRGILFTESRDRHYGLIAGLEVRGKL